MFNPAVIREFTPQNYDIGNTVRMVHRVMRGAFFAYPGFLELRKWHCPRKRAVCRPFHYHEHHGHSTAVRRPV
jgi:hypothetical protein